MSNTRQTAPQGHDKGGGESPATTDMRPGADPDRRSAGRTADEPAQHNADPYYPDIDMPFAQTVPEQYERFAQIREDICLDYAYNTARAYWADLDDLLYWAIQRNKDPLHLTDKDLTQYIALHRRRHYSENTIRRRLVVIRKLQQRVSEAEQSDK